MKNALLLNDLLNLVYEERVTTLRREPSSHRYNASKYSTRQMEGVGAVSEPREHFC
jgi:hypothetical protein